MSETYSLDGASIERERAAMPEPSPFTRLVVALKKAAPKWDPPRVLLDAWERKLGGISPGEAHDAFDRWVETFSTSTPTLKQLLEAVEAVRRENQDTPEQMAERAAFCRKLRVVMERKPKIERGGLVYDPYITDEDIEAARREDDPSPEPWGEECDPAEIGKWAGTVVDRLCGRLQR